MLRHGGPKGVDFTVIGLLNRRKTVDKMQKQKKFDTINEFPFSATLAS